MPNTAITPQGCNKSGKFAFIVHGFGPSDSKWISDLISKLLTYRGGCVINVNWGKNSNSNSYEHVLYVDVPKVSDTITRRLQHLETEGVSGDNIFMYGHSLGARLVVQAARIFGKRKVARIHGDLQIILSMILISFSTTFQKFATQPVQILTTKTAYMTQKMQLKMFSAFTHQLYQGRAPEIATKIGKLV